MNDDPLNTGDFTGHVRGAEECDACWWNVSEECDEGHPACRVHTEFGDENYNGDYWLQRRHEADYTPTAMHGAADKLGEAMG